MIYYYKNTYNQHTVINQNMVYILQQVIAHGRNQRPENIHCFSDLIHIYLTYTLNKYHYP